MIGPQMILTAKRLFTLNHRAKFADSFPRAQKTWTAYLSVLREVGVLLLVPGSLWVMAPHPMAEFVSLQNEEDLSDEQVAALLKEAEDRLRLRKGDPGDPRVSAPYKPLPKLKHGVKTSSMIKEKDGIAAVDAARLLDPEQRKMADAPRVVGPIARLKKTNDETSAGSDWFNLPKTVVTPQLKRDFQLLEMRSVLDPHRHYKREARKGKIPAFSQVGTVVQGPTEWYSSRINKKDRAKNFVEETMAVEQDNGRFKRKYEEIQVSKTSGKKAHYKSLMAKRNKRA